MLIKGLVIGLLIFVPSIVFGAPNDLCYENYDCSMAELVQQPLKNILMPFDIVLPNFGMLVVWGPIVMAIWILSKDALVTGIFGMLISGVMTGLNQEAVAIGMLLFAISLGFALFTLYPRLKNIA